MIQWFKRYFYDRWTSADKNLKAFLTGIFLLGINGGILGATFNNYLNDSFTLSAAARGLLEFPRELPGFLLIAAVGVLAAFPMRTWALIVGFGSAVGVMGLGFFFTVGCGDDDLDDYLEFG